MKSYITIKKLLAFLITVSLILSGTSTVALGDSPKALNSVCEERFLSSATANSQESSDYLAIKNTLWEGLYNLDEKIYVSDFNLPATQSSVDLLYEIAFEQLPAAFHINGFTPYVKGGNLYYIVPAYTYDKQTYHNMYKECVRSANWLLRGIKGNNKLGEVEKALLIHDRIAEHCAYDEEHLENGNIPSTSFNMYGVLVNRTAVCQGYTDAYIYLLDLVGIKSDFCESEELCHAWNIVYIDGEAYHVDITWDDPVWDISGRVHHNNFLLSTKALQEGVNSSTPHDATDFKSYPTSTKYDNYFWQDSETAFQLVNNEIYYIDTKNTKLKRYSDKSVLTDVAGIWPVNALYYYKDFARLTSDGDHLYYSSRSAVYMYDLEKNKSKKIFEPKIKLFDLEGIYGLVYEDGYLICDILSKPSYTGTKKQEKFFLHKDTSKGDVDGNGAATITDIVLLERHVVGWVDNIDWHDDQLDFNGDNKVTLYDILLLARYLAGWDISLN